MKNIISRNYAKVNSAQEMKIIVKRIWDHFRDEE
jgi:hypothetical protein